MGTSREFGDICMYNRTLKKTKSGECLERENVCVCTCMFTCRAGKKEVMTEMGTKGFQGEAIFSLTPTLVAQTFTLGEIRKLHIFYFNFINFQFHFLKVKKLSEIICRTPNTVTDTH